MIDQKSRRVRLYLIEEQEPYRQLYDLIFAPRATIDLLGISTNVETEICGRINGDVIAEGRLYLGPSGVVTGNVRAGSCKLEGLVEGKMECSQELELTRTGRLNSDTNAGRKVTVAGQIYGTVSTGGAVRIVNSGKIEGNVQAKQIFIEEGAKFNGRCTMRVAAERRPAAK